jgi:hypothetical protein
VSFQEFDDECHGCKPAMMNIETGRVEPDDSPSMKIVLRVWSKTTLAERQAWHRVTCQNSRTLVDLQVAQNFTQRVQAALLQKEPS